VFFRDGGHVSSTLWGDTWVRACKKVGVEGVKFYDLRQTFVSALISGGASVKQVQAAVGHASAAVTLDTYAKLWPTDEDTTRAAFDRSWTAEDSVRTEAAE
jgi:integrase